MTSAGDARKLANQAIPDRRSSVGRDVSATRGGSSSALAQRACAPPGITSSRRVRTRTALGSTTTRKRLLLLAFAAVEVVQDLPTAGGEQDAESTQAPHRAVKPRGSA
jgi:hypothetical protein